MRQGCKWSPEHRSSQTGLRSFTASSVTMLDHRMTQALIGTLYPSIWDTCASLYIAIFPDSFSCFCSIGACDTTSTTLSYLCWELSRRPDISGKLQAELDTVMPDCKTFPDISILQDLPYLSVFIKEGSLYFIFIASLMPDRLKGLRLYGAAPSLLERVVPSSSIKSAIPEAFDLMGYALPPETLVATQAWSVHRSPSVFPSPASFLPERWLETGDNREQLEAMNRHMMPFGTGSRVCGGQNLAQLALRIAIAAIARNFDIISPPETTETSMEMRDSFVCYPFGTSHSSETVDVVVSGYISSVNGLSPDLQPTPDSLNSSNWHCLFSPLFFVSETFISPPYLSCCSFCISRVDLRVTYPSFPTVLSLLNVVSSWIIRKPRSLDCPLIS
jgi:hypothetical protein